ncbi:hypothetical protein QTP70_012747 [Hemibagrus guttatus]|uniref:Tc1-like transposase DDE domain-containing protein n=1 Tax=Hemibagrus guttatus TaxID=175788 RepID=A0AAE0R2U5_9TELE|nr:hypothetical protein QTP70_012747 [Hemibagrus guttatus]
MAPGCTMGRRRAGGGSVMLWAMFCWETLGPAIHVDVTLTRTTYLSIVTDHVHLFMEAVFPDGCGLFQQDNAPCHKAKMLQEWFDEHNNQFEVLTWAPNSPDLNPIQHLWDVPDKQVRSMEAPHNNLQDLKDLVPDTTAHLQGSSGVHASTGSEKAPERGEEGFDVGGISTDEMIGDESRDNLYGYSSSYTLNTDAELSNLEKMNLAIRRTTGPERLTLFVFHVQPNLCSRFGSPKPNTIIVITIIITIIITITTIIIIITIITTSTIIITSITIINISTIIITTSTIITTTSTITTIITIIAIIIITIISIIIITNITLIIKISTRTIITIKIISTIITIKTIITTSTIITIIINIITVITTTRTIITVIINVITIIINISTIINIISTITIIISTIITTSTIITIINIITIITNIITIITTTRTIITIINIISTMIRQN